MRRLFLVSLFLISGLFFTFCLVSMLESQVASFSTGSIRNLPPPEAVALSLSAKGSAADFLHSSFSILLGTRFFPGERLQSMAGWKAASSN